jgi:mRNA interferase MazF
MTLHRKGDVVLVSFVFSDESGEKRRPALVLSSDLYNRNRKEVIIAAITSKTGRILEGDYMMSDWRDAGLLFPSLITGIIRTIRGEMIVARLGSLSNKDIQGVEGKLMDIFGLDA